MKTKICVIKRILWVIFGTVFLFQVCLAVAWAFTSVQSVQEFYETDIYIQSIVRRTTDGWHLPGYSVLLFCMRRLFGFAEQGSVLGMYLIQTAFSLYCFTEAVRSVVLIMTKHNLKYGYAFLAAVYIVTNPMIWQMQFALLPDAMCLAAVVILFAKLLELCRTENSFRLYCLYVVTGSLLLTGTFERHYFYAGVLLTAVMTIVAIIRLWKRKGCRREAYKLMFLTPLIVVLVSLIAAYYPAFVGIEGEYPKYSLAADSMHRAVLPYFEKTHGDYSGEIQSYLTEEMVAAACAGERAFYTDFLSELEQLAGEGAGHLYRKMISETVRMNLKDISLRMGKEMAGYLLAPVSFVKYTYHSGNARFGYNLSRMWEVQPELANAYAIIGTNGMCIFVLAALGIGWAELLMKKEDVKPVLSAFGAMLTANILVTLPKMIPAPIQIDYRVGLFSLSVWMIAALSLFLKKYVSEEKEDG